MFVPHVPQMWYKCGTQMRPHTFFRSQSSILGSQSSLYPKSGVLLSLYPKYPKWGTSGVHKRGLTRFLDDLSIMHLMYVYIHEKSEIKTYIQVETLARTPWSNRGVKIGWTSLRIFTFLGA